MQAFGFLSGHDIIEYQFFRKDADMERHITNSETETLALGKALAQHLSTRERRCFVRRPWIG